MQLWWSGNKQGRKKNDEWFGQSEQCGCGSNDLQHVLSGVGIMHENESWRQIENRRDSRSGNKSRMNSVCLFADRSKGEKAGEARVRSVWAEDVCLVCVCVCVIVSVSVRSVNAWQLVGGHF